MTADILVVDMVIVTVCPLHRFALFLLTALFPAGVPHAPPLRAHVGYMLHLYYGYVPADRSNVPLFFYKKPFRFPRFFKTES